MARRRIILTEQQLDRWLEYLYLPKLPQVKCELFSFRPNAMNEDELIGLCALGACVIVNPELNPSLIERKESGDLYLKDDGVWMLSFAQGIWEMNDCGKHSFGEIAAFLEQHREEILDPNSEFNNGNHLLAIS